MSRSRLVKSIVNVLFFTRRKIRKIKDLHQFAAGVCRNVSKLRGGGEICVIFITDVEIKKINRRFLDKNRATDVIAFNYASSCRGAARRAPTGFRNAVPFGDIYISLDTAMRRAKIGRYPYCSELALLVAHGLLHLSGYRDYIYADRIQMFTRQKRLFRELRPDLAPPDFRV